MDSGGISIMHVPDGRFDAIQPCVRALGVSVQRDQSLGETRAILGQCITCVRERQTEVSSFFISHASSLRDGQQADIVDERTGFDTAREGEPYLDQICAVQSGGELELHVAVAFLRGAG